jgi:hypothetical protein
VAREQEFKNRQTALTAIQNALAQTQHSVVQPQLKQREAELNRASRRNDDLALQRMNIQALNSRRILLQNQLKIAMNEGNDSEASRINAALADVDRALAGKTGAEQSSTASGAVLDFNSI